MHVCFGGRTLGALYDMEKILNFSQLRQKNNTECSTFLYDTNSKGHSTLTSTTNLNRRVNKPSSAMKLEDY